MRRTRFLLAAIVATLTVPSAARAADPAASKVLTPDAMGFVHVRVGDIWSADVAKQLKTFTAQAGDLLNDFDTRFVPAPSDVESFTVVLFDTTFRDVLPVGRPTDKTPVWVITSKKPLDKPALLKTMADGGKARTHGGKEYFFDENVWAGALILDERTYAYASEDSITALIDRMAKGGSGPLAAVLSAEHDKHPVTLGVNPSTFAKPDVLKVVPEPLQPMFKAKTWVATLDLKAKTTVSFAIDFGTEAGAKDGLKAAQESVQMTRGFIADALTFMEKRIKKDPAKPATVGIQQFPETVGLLLAAAGLKQLDGLLGTMPLETKGTAVRGSLDLDSVLPGGSTAVSVGVVAMAIAYAVGDADRTDGSRIQPGNYEWTDRERNLASLAKAVEKYKADKGHYPPPAILSKDGKPLLSWRVAIMPYMENAYINVPYPEKGINSPKALYDMFKLDEPWDGPNNKKLIGYFPSLYRAPYSVLTYPASSMGKTTVVAVVGKGAIFDPTKEVTEASVRDGLSQTLLLLSLEESARAVYWTKPADFELTKDGKLPANGPNLGKRFGAVYADGSARTLSSGLDDKSFMGIVTRDGSEKLDEKTIRPDPMTPPGGPPK